MGALNITGLLLSLFGVILLFRYGMPFRLPFLGEPLTLRPEPGDDRDLAKHKWLGGTGLAFIILGTALQVFVTHRTMPLLS